MGGRRKRNLDLRGSVFVIGEGITEQHYFTHLKHLKKYKCVVKPRFFGKTSIDEIEKSVKKLLQGEVSVICVFDADVSERNIVEKEKLNRFKKEYQRNKNVLICDSLPSIEFWFLLHFVKTTKHFQNSKAVERELKKFISDYNKTDNYLKNSRWVEQLIEKLEIACDNAKSIGQIAGSSYSNIFKAIEKFEKL
jgi:hypothetical protein